MPIPVAGQKNHISRAACFVHFLGVDKNSIIVFSFNTILGVHFADRSHGNTPIEIRLARGMGSAYYPVIHHVIQCLFVL